MPSERADRELYQKRIIYYFSITPMQIFSPQEAIVKDHGDSRAGKTKRKKIKVTFATNHNIGFVGGGEKVLMNYLRYAPLDRFDVTFFQSNFTDSKDNPGLKNTKFPEAIRIITAKAHQSKLYIFSRSKIPLILSIIFMYPALFFFLRCFSYRKLISTMKDTDIVYVFQNEMSSLFSHTSAVVIGSNHSSMSKDSSLITRMVTALMGSGLFYRNIDGVHLFPSSVDLKKRIKKGYNLVLTNGVDTSRFSPYEIPRTEGKIRYLYVARLEPYKGVVKLLKAWDLIKDRSNIELHIAGAGPLEDLVRSRAGDNLIYHGSVSHEVLSAIHRESDIFVTTSEMDTFGLVVLEALSSGLYVIAPEMMKGTFDDFMDMGSLEYVKNEPEIVAERMLKAAEKIDTIRSSRLNLHQYVKEHYDWKVVVDELYDFFESVAKDKER